MWITAWIIAASAALAQPNYPAFRTEDDCRAVLKIYLGNRPAAAADCVQVGVWQR